jgi:hypothetical protein
LLYIFGISLCFTYHRRRFHFQCSLPGNDKNTQQENYYNSLADGKGYQHIHPGLEREQKTEEDQHGDLNLSC